MDSKCNADIENRFEYHRPTEEQQKKYIELRQKAKEMAYRIEVCCPPSREKSLAMTKLQEAIMWANASIACNEQMYPSDK